MKPGFIAFVAKGQCGETDKKDPKPRFITGCTKTRRISDPPLRYDAKVGPLTRADKERPKLVPNLAANLERGCSKRQINQINFAL